MIQHTVAFKYRVSTCPVPSRPHRVSQKFCVAASIVCAGLLAGCANSAQYIRNSPPLLDNFTSADVLRAAEDRLPAFFACLRSKNVPIISAHRGAPNYQMPENAIATFAKTASKGAIIMEVDILPSADGVFFLHHDETLERSTTGIGPINEAKAVTLRQLKLRDKAGRSTIHSMNTFDQLLEWSAGRSLLQLDVKPPTSVAAVVEAVRAANASGRVIYIMYSLEDATTLRQLQPDAIVSIGVNAYSDIKIAVSLGLDADKIHALVNDLEPKPEFYSELTKSGVSVVFGTFREPTPIDDMDSHTRSAMYRRISSSGVALIVTNKPGALQEALYERDDFRIGLTECGVGAGRP